MFDFGRFTKRVKVVLEIAKKEAIRYGHNKIETEHILLAMVEEAQGIGVEMLRAMGVDPDKVKAGVEKSMRMGVPLLILGDVPLSGESKKVLELSVGEAQGFGHNYVGTEHLLLGLLAEENGLASRILAHLGATYQRARQYLEEMLTEPEQQKGWGEQKAPGKQQSKSKTPALDAFGRDLTALAREGKLDPVVGREKEIERVTQILCRRKKNNPVLLGEAGVGKTAIVEGFAQRIAAGATPEILKNRQIIMVDLAAMVAGTKYRGEFEQRVKAVLDEIRAAPEIIIFIDELHTLVGAGGAEGAIDASNILKPALSRGEIQCIGATTLDEYRKHIEKDGALERRFQPVIVNPPSREETVLILKGLRSQYERHHRLTITDDAVEASAALSERYIAGRCLPDKAIDVMDEAASKQRLKLSCPPPELDDLGREAEEVTRRKEEAIANQDFEKAAGLRDRERDLKNKLDFMKQNWEKLIPDEKRVVNRENVTDIVSQWTGIPVVQLRKEEKERLLEMEKALHAVVVGQDEAISAVSRAVRRSRVGLKDRNRPIGSCLFLGPTGVGKTLLARALAEFLFGDDKSLIQVDMSEYMEKFSVSRLIGAPPGYVGYEEGGQLTERVRRRPYSVILLDEIEKAHPEVFNLLLQVLEEGRLTDSFGRGVSFHNTLVIMTSNVGTQALRTTSIAGFKTDRDAAESHEAVKERILEEVRKTFRPEFLNRLDETIVFHPLTREHLLGIVDLEIGKVAERLAEQNLSVLVSDDAKSFLIERGTNPQLGARPLKRTISRYLEDPLSEEILKEKFPERSVIMVRRKGEALAFDLHNQTKGDAVEHGERNRTALASS